METAGAKQVPLVGGITRTLLQLWLGLNVVVISAVLFLAVFLGYRHQRLHNLPLGVLGWGAGGWFIGVGALVSISLFASHVNRAVTREARGLLGGDVEVRASRPLSMAGQQILASLADRRIATTHVSELVAMAARTDAAPGSPHSTQIVELKAVEADYPFYGTLRLEPDRPLWELLQPRTAGCPATRCWGAVVQESLLVRMGLAVGQWDVAQNVEGAAVERLVGRSIMSRFHASFSVGTVMRQV